MDSVRGPSERLCEVGLDLATRLNRYEDGGGTSQLEDVITTPAFVDVFDRGASVIGRARPQWRWEIRLREGHDVETIVGHANGRWTVEGLDMLAHAAPVERPCEVVIEPAGTDLEFKPPPADSGPGTEAVSSQVPMIGPLVFVRSLVALGNAQDPRGSTTASASRSCQAVSISLLERHTVDRVRPRNSGTAELGRIARLGEPLSSSQGVRTRLFPSTACRSAPLPAIAQLRTVHREMPARCGVVAAVRASSV